MNTSEKCAHETNPFPNRIARFLSLNGAAAVNSVAISSAARLTPGRRIVTAGPWNCASCGKSSDRDLYVFRSSEISNPRAQTTSATSATSLNACARSSYAGRSLLSVAAEGHGSRSVEDLSTA